MVEVHSHCQHHPRGPIASLINCISSFRLPGSSPQPYLLTLSLLLPQNTELSLVPQGDSALHCLSAQLCILGSQDGSRNRELRKAQLGGAFVWTHKVQV